MMTSRAKDGKCGESVEIVEANGSEVVSVPALPAATINHYSPPIGNHYMNPTDSSSPPTPPRATSLPIVVGITGASGAAYAVRVIELLVAAGVETHVAISALGRRLLHDELGLKRLDADALTNGRGGVEEGNRSGVGVGRRVEGHAGGHDGARVRQIGKVIIHADNDVGATIASGSFLHGGMIIVPCSSNTLAKVAAGITDNLVQRAAAVTLKERRRLVLAYRESPMSHIDILNMQRISEAGGIIAPLAPGFYLLPQTLEEIVDFMAGKLLDLVGVPHELKTRWESAKA